MGKRIISQARGKGSMIYRVRKKAFKHKITYPRKTGEAEIIKLIHSAGHSAPLMKIKLGKEIAITPAFDTAFESQKIQIGQGEPKIGNVLPLSEIPNGTQIFNIEKNPGDGGKMFRAGGTSAVFVKNLPNNKAIIKTPKKKEVILSSKCRATIGEVAGQGRKDKPFITAGKKYYKKKAKSKLWPRTSAVNFNAIDHPFGSGRGKRIKSKIAKLNAPPGKKVGHLRPKRTGKKKK